MIKAKLLNSEASLNSFFTLNTIEYVPGSSLTIVIRLEDSQKGIRYIPTDLATTVSLTLVTDPSIADISVPATVVDALDRSMWKVTLTPAQTADIISNNIGINIDVDGTGANIQKSVIFNVLSRLIIDGDC